MKTSSVFIIVMVLTMVPTSTSLAGDKEWRRFGEAAAILWTVRALTGWDPIGEIAEYPRKRILRDKEVVYRKPTNVHIHYNTNRDDKISAFPTNHPQRHTNELTSESKFLDDEYVVNEHELEPQSRKRTPYSARGNDLSGTGSTSYPNPKDSKPPVILDTRIEDGYELQTRRIWVAPHWEKKVIEGHWRGDVWVDTHSEKRLIEGEWKVIEYRKSLAKHD